VLPKLDIRIATRKKDNVRAIFVEQAFALQGTNGGIAGGGTKGGVGGNGGNGTSGKTISLMVRMGECSSGMDIKRLV
jgi:hypothetical protein